jgi:hypothetical protein
MDNMIKSIVREHHWTPNTINDLYVDDMDHFGIEYWFDDVKEVSDSLKPKK